MAAKVGLHVEVQGDDIVVTLPGTSYAVTYYRATAFPQQLLTKSHSGREDQGAPMTQAAFLMPAPGRLPTPRQKSSAGSSKLRQFRPMCLSRYEQIWRAGSVVTRWPCGVAAPNFTEREKRRPRVTSEG